ncbi:MAG: hypothetical protein V3V10_10855 [Planctomycetota bacterium]
MANKYTSDQRHILNNLDLIKRYRTLLNDSLARDTGKFLGAAIYDYVEHKGLAICVGEYDSMPDLADDGPEVDVEADHSRDWQGALIEGIGDVLGESGYIALQEIKFGSHSFVPLTINFWTDNGVQASCRLGYRPIVAVVGDQREAENLLRTHDVPLNEKNGWEEYYPGSDDKDNKARKRAVNWHWGVSTVPSMQLRADYISTKKARLKEVWPTMAEVIDIYTKCVKEFPKLGLSAITHEDAESKLLKKPDAEKVNTNSRLLKKITASDSDAESRFISESLPSLFTIENKWHDCIESLNLALDERLASIFKPVASHVGKWFESTEMVLNEGKNKIKIEFEYPADRGILQKTMCVVLDTSTIASGKKSSKWSEIIRILKDRDYPAWHFGTARTTHNFSGAILGFGELSIEYSEFLDDPMVLDRALKPVLEQLGKVANLLEEM